MNTEISKVRTLPAKAIVGSGVGVGFAGDQLLRASGDPGLNFFLLFAGLGLSAWSVTHRRGARLSREASVWLVVGVACAAALMWRGSGMLRFAAFVAACSAFALPALHAGKAWVRGSGVLDLGKAMAWSALHAGFGGLLLASRDNWDEASSEGVAAASHTVVKTAIGGLLLAGIPLVVFGALFASADQVFARLVGDFVRVDLGALVSHIALAGILSWLACGYLAGFAGGVQIRTAHALRPRRPSIGVAPVATALGLVDLLFLTFVIIQFRYLFGGGALVEVTPGLTYATYARAGFFQLVVAVALAIPWLLATHSLLGAQTHKSRSVFAGFAGVHVLLLLVIVASAFQRMRVYQEAYGLTEDRVVVIAILVWLAAVVVWFGATVLGGQRERFAFGSLASAFVLVGALQVMNPAGMVANHNLDRMSEAGGIDTAHLASLGSDAAPILADRLDELPPAAQCWVAIRMIDRWGPDRPADWRSFNLSEHRARHAVNQHLSKLESRAITGGCR